MIDFDDIDGQEVAATSPALKSPEAIDEVLVRREERRTLAEQRQAEEQARFAQELAIQEEAARRCRNIEQAVPDKNKDNIHGVRIYICITSTADGSVRPGQSSIGQIRGPAAIAGGPSRNVAQGLLVDALNAAFSDIGKIFLAKDCPDTKVTRHCQRGLAALVAFLNGLLQCHFHRNAITHFEKAYQWLVKPKKGVCALLPEAIASKRENNENILLPEILAVPVHHVLQALEKALHSVSVKQRAEAVGRTEALEAAHKELVVFLAPLAAKQSNKFPSVKPGEEAWQVSLVLPESQVPERQLLVRADLTVGELKALVVEFLRFPPSVELLGKPCHEEESGDFAWFPPDTRLQTLHHRIMAWGVGTLTPDTDPLPDPPFPLGMFHELTFSDFVYDKVLLTFEILHGRIFPNNDPVFRPSRIRSRWRICKTTPAEMTRLLHELCLLYMEVEFQDKYTDLRRKMQHIQFTLETQQAVLPKYNFPGTIEGVNEMRGEVTLHEMFHLDKTVEFMRKESHRLLEYGEPFKKMPITRPIEPRRFEILDADSWLRHLANEGYAVISGVANQSEVAEAYGLLWDFIEESDNKGFVKRNTVHSWLDSSVQNCGWPGGKDDGIIHSRGIGQSKAMWYMRSLPALQAVFATIWGTEHLATSFDGAGAFRPYGHLSSWKTTKRNWFHMDQNHKKRGFQCVQGLLTLKDADRHTGGLVVVPKSHRFFNDTLTRYDEPQHPDSLQLRLSDQVLTEGESGPRLVCARAGDLIIWDSRTVHCNTPPLEDEPSVLERSDLIRAVAYICMTPAARLTDEVARKRKEAFNRGVTTTHVPHVWRPMDIPEKVPPRFNLSQPMNRLIVPPWLEKAGAPKPVWNFALQPNAAAATATAATAPPTSELELQAVTSSTPLPQRRFRVKSDSVPIRSVPTMEWGINLGSMKHGNEVAGHVYGEWLLLQDATRPDDTAGDDGEEWLPLTKAALNSGRLIAPCIGGSAEGPRGQEQLKQTQYLVEDLGYRDEAAGVALEKKRSKLQSRYLETLEFREIDPHELRARSDAEKRVRQQMEALPVLPSAAARALAKPTCARETSGQRCEVATEVPSSVGLPVVGVEMGQETGTSSPGAVEPQLAETGSSSPGTVEPQLAETGSSSPGTVEPQLAETGSSSPGTVEPQLAEPEPGCEAVNGELPLQPTDGAAWASDWLVSHQASPTPTPVAPVDASRGSPASPEISQMHSQLCYLQHVVVKQTQHTDELGGLLPVIEEMRGHLDSIASKVNGVPAPLRK